MIGTKTARNTNSDRPTNLNAVPESKELYFCFLIFRRGIHNHGDCRNECVKRKKSQRRNEDRTVDLWRVNRVEGFVATTNKKKVERHRRYLRATAAAAASVTSYWYNIRTSTHHIRSEINLLPDLDSISRKHNIFFGFRRFPCYLRSVQLTNGSPVVHTACSNHSFIVVQQLKLCIPISVCGEDARKKRGKRGTQVRRSRN